MFNTWKTGLQSNSALNVSTDFSLTRLLGSLGFMMLVVL